jgi:hypothetical protein
MATAQPTTPLPEADPVRHRAISSAYRARIVAEAAEIRCMKGRLRELQRQGSDLAPGAQSALAHSRNEARARLIAYGLHRGMALERMEGGRTSLDQLPWTVRMLVRGAAERAEREAQP